MRIVDQRNEMELIPSGHKNKLLTDEIAMRINFAQTENDYLAIPCGN